jgi:hypothetical protein
MAAVPEAKVLYGLAKDAGNKLRAYLLSYSSAATAVFFLALTGRDMEIFTRTQKTLLIFALLFYVLTALLCLLELWVDSRRFFAMADDIDKKLAFDENRHYKRLRLGLIYTSYVTAGLATVLMVVYLILRIA